MNFMSFTYRVTLNVRHDTATETEDKEREEPAHYEMGRQTAMKITEKSCGYSGDIIFTKPQVEKSNYFTFQSEGKTN